MIEGERVKDHANLLAEKDGELNEIKKLVEAKEMEMRELQFKHDQKHRKITELLVNAEHSAAQLKTMETELRQLKVNVSIGVKTNVELFILIFCLYRKSITMHWIN